MSILRFPLKFQGSEGEKTLFALFDSGATLSCVNKSILEKLEKPVRLPNTRKLGTASAGHFIEISQRVSLDFYMDDILLSDEFLVVPELSEEAIIGVATMQKWRIKLDFENDKVEVDPKVAKLQLI